MLTLTCCQDHILAENIWFVCSETSWSGDERRCHRCRTNEQLKIELLSQWKLEADSRKLPRKCVAPCVTDRGQSISISLISASANVSHSHASSDRSHSLIFLLLRERVHSCFSPFSYSHPCYESCVSQRPIPDRVYQSTK